MPLLKPSDNEGIVPSVDKRPTDEMRPMRGELRMTLDLENPEAVAQFLEAVATSIRTKRRITLVIE